MSQSFLREYNTIVKDPRLVDILVGYCYPSTYRAGMTSLATHLFYRILNSREDVSCERYFRFDTKSPIHSIETSRHLKENHLVTFSLTWEEDIVHLIQMLEKSAIDPSANKRRDQDPIVVVGGPVPSANPEPFVDFVDAFVIGEGDLVINHIIDVMKESSTRAHALELLSGIPGVYVPSANPTSIKHLIIDRIDDLLYPVAQIIPDVPEGSKLEPVFGKSFLLEVTRGCGHSCRFCLVGHICRPRRARTFSRLMQIVEEGIENTPVDKVSLIGSSLGDIDQIAELSSWIVNKNLELSAPSLRADTVTFELLSTLVKGGQRTLTIAPETGSERLRKIVGKGLSDAEIEHAVMLASETGYKSVKLYFIIGLPEESQDDIIAIADMTKRLARKSGLRITASISPFVPKARTRWEREVQQSVEVLRKKAGIIEKELRNHPNAVMESSDPRNARIQAALSIGARDLGRVIVLAAKYGGLGGWRRAEKETKVAFFSIANDPNRKDDALPWSFITH
ncbi:MAG: radical SAM protein [Candidatus Thorarchaeota archaeon]|nr:radical SAM protein [Candidatus Thorarchaeota archaeon]